MGNFGGFIGKNGEHILQKMTKSICQNILFEPICFSDGYLHLAFEPFEEEEYKKIGHSQDFTKWIMIDAAGDDNAFSPDNLLKAYEEKGISFLKELKGVYAMALWDSVYKKLYLIRDKYGGKGLFYTKTKGGIIFGSKLSALLCHDDVKREINKEAIYQYLSYQSIYPPNTAFEGIFQVPAGNCLEYTAGEVKKFSYCEMPFDSQSMASYEEATKKVFYLLEKSVESKIKGERGIFLSGGVDSSLLAAMACDKIGKSSIKYAFCLEPDTKKNSLHRKGQDAVFAKELADKYGMQYYVWQIGAKDLLKQTDNILKAFGQPFSSTMSGFFLAERCKEICKHILTGDGADELFGGYGYHSVLLPLEKYGYCIQNKMSLYGREKEFAPYDTQMTYLDNLYQYGKADGVLTYYRLLLMTDAEKEIFLNSEVFGEFIEEKHTLKELVYCSGKLQSKGTLNRCLERDFLYTLPGHTLLYTDTLTRNFGLMPQMPYLDDALVTYLISLPQEYKMREGQLKAVLKDCGKDFLPQKILYRKKEPFSLPVAEWMQEELKEYVTDILSKESVKKHGLLNEVCVEYALREFYTKPEEKAYLGPMLWSMTMLERWFSLYM